MYSYKLKIKISNNIPFFGPGTVELLEAIESTGSLKVACEKMNLSYTKGRKMLKDIESETQEKAIIFKHGGIGGGNATLTEHGKNLLIQYKAFIKEANEEVLKVFNKYYGGSDV